MLPPQHIEANETALATTDEISNILLQTLMEVSFLRKWNLHILFMYTALPCPMMYAGQVVVLFLLKLTTISLVLVTLKSRWFNTTQQSCLLGPYTLLPVHHCMHMKNKKKCHCHCGVRAVQMGFGRLQ